MRRASSHLSVSSCLCLPPPPLSFSFLPVSPSLWGNHVDLYEIWSVSAKTSTLHNLSPSPWGLFCNPPSYSPSPFFYISFLAAFLTSLSLNLFCHLKYTFWQLSSYLSFTYGCLGIVYVLVHVCMCKYMHVSTMAWCISKVISLDWSPQVCKN